jgi:hypothetical protein
MKEASEIGIQHEEIKPPSTQLLIQLRGVALKKLEDFVKPEDIGKDWLQQYLSHKNEKNGQLSIIQLNSRVDTVKNGLSYTIVPKSLFFTLKQFDRIGTFTVGFYGELSPSGEITEETVLVSWKYIPKYFVQKLIPTFNAASPATPEEIALYNRNIYGTPTRKWFGPRFT